MSVLGGRLSAEAEFQTEAPSIVRCFPKSDLEGDGLTDNYYGGECALVSEPLDQSHLSCSADEDEPELGWANTGSQSWLALRYSSYTGDGTSEGDGDCDAEDDDPGGDVLD